MSVCVVVADDAGARAASHALRASGWGGVHFESDPAAAVRMTANGRATVLNVQRAADDDVADVFAQLGDAAFDWRAPLPELSQDEWLILTADGDAARAKMTPRTAANRMASARAAFGVATDDELLSVVAPYRLPAPD